MRASYATPSASSVSAACRRVGQSDWLPMMIATSAGRLIGPSLESRVAPTKRSDAMDRARLALRSAVEGSGASGDDVGRQLVLKVGDPILQGELALLEALDLQLIAGRHLLQGVDRPVEVAVLLLEPRQLRLQLGPFRVRIQSHASSTRGAPLRKDGGREPEYAPPQSPGQQRGRPALWRRSTKLGIDLVAPCGTLGESE